ncbi:MAG: type II toxin-antitoxin system HicB family antitoxin [Polaromonas sp.]
MKFIVVLHTDDGERFGVTVPDLAGCFSGATRWTTRYKACARR